MKPPRTLGLQKTWEALQRHLELVSKTLSNISFGVTTGNNTQDTNISCWKAAGTSPASANTEFAVSHNLKHIPIGFLILLTNPAGHLYKSTTAWTAATNSAQGTIYLKSDVASVTYVIAVV